MNHILNSGKSVAGFILAGGLVTFVTLPFYGLANHMYYDIRGDSISHIVYRDFDKECVKKFHKESQNIWFNSPMNRGRAIVVTYQKWKKSGEWDHCCRA